MIEAEIADICNQLAEGKSLRLICEESGICERTVYRRLRDDEAFSQEYARARKTWADAQIEQIIAVSTDPLLGADHKRVQIDTLKWAMGKLNGKYSDKVKHVGGDEGDAPIRTESATTLNIEGLNDDQLRALASIRVPTE